MSLYKVAIIGAAGFVGAELARLVIAHPELDLIAVSSDSSKDKSLAEVYPYFAGRTDLDLMSHEELLKYHAAEADLVFLPVPHTAALALVPELLEKGVSVIDLSADFRLEDTAQYEQWYGVTHTAPELMETTVYGMPELTREDLSILAVRRTHDLPALIANPGCYPTASTLAALPALKAGLQSMRDVVVINAISGISGAGKKANDTTQFCLGNENINAYGVTSHRHTPEIAQTYEKLAGCEVSLQFTPHIAPLNRGMISTVTIKVSKTAAKIVNTEMLQRIYEDAYKDEPFVVVTPAGVMPKSSSVKYSNYAHVGVAYDETNQMIVASCAIDNLGKGAASQAVQCANILLGLSETAGLENEGGFL